MGQRIVVTCRPGQGDTLGGGGETVHAPAGEHQRTPQRGFDLGPQCRSLGASGPHRGAVYWSRVWPELGTKTHDRPVSSAVGKCWEGTSDLRAVSLVGPTLRGTRVSLLIAVGYATLGRIGFEGRFDYGAVGSVVNLAARLCGEALGGQILLADRAFAAVEGTVAAEPLDPLTLKGFHRPVQAYLVANPIEHP